MLDDGSAIVHPVAAIEIEDAVEPLQRWSVEMAADNAVHAPRARWTPIPSKRRMFNRSLDPVAAGSVVSRYSACIVAAQGTGKRLRRCCGAMTIL
jgi:hypothetical protein